MGSSGAGVGRKISSIPVGFDSEGRPIRRRRRRKPPTLGECLLYPILDGPAVGLMVAFPPFLTVLGIPVLDFAVHFTEKDALNPINLLLIPFTLPLVFFFSFLLGWFFLFLGRVLAASALGEEDHPRWPNWDNHEISEGLGRWIWAGIWGLGLGGFPAAIYWINCGDVDFVDWLIFIDLAILGACYAQLALVAALLHESILAANPFSVVAGIGRIGWDYVAPSVTTLTILALNLGAWYSVLKLSPSMGIGLLGSWACWTFSMYSLTAIFRVLGVMYDAHASDLGWFRHITSWKY